MTSDVGTTTQKCHISFPSREHGEQAVHDVGLCRFFESVFVLLFLTHDLVWIPSNLAMILLCFIIFFNEHIKPAHVHFIIKSRFTFSIVHGEFFNGHPCFMFGRIQ